MSSRDVFDTRFGVVPKVLIETEAYQDFKFQDATVTFVRGFLAICHNILNPSSGAFINDPGLVINGVNDDILP